MSAGNTGGGSVSHSGWSTGTPPTLDGRPAAPAVVNGRVVAAPHPLDDTLALGAERGRLGDADAAERHGLGELMLVLPAVRGEVAGEDEVEVVVARVETDRRPHEGLLEVDVPALDVARLEEDEHGVGGAAYEDPHHAVAVPDIVVVGPVAVRQADVVALEVRGTLPDRARRDVGRDQLRGLLDDDERPGGEDAAEPDAAAGDVRTGRPALRGHAASVYVCDLRAGGC